MTKIPFVLHMHSRDASNEKPNIQLYYVIDEGNWFRHVYCNALVKSRFFFMRISDNNIIKVYNLLTEDFRYYAFSSCEHSILR